MWFQLKLRANCSKKANPEQCDWNAFRMNNELQKQYTVDVKNRYEALLHSELLDSPTDKYGLFVKANADVKESLVPKQVKKKRSVISNDPRVQEARDEMNRAYLTFAKTLSPDTRQDLREAKVKLYEAYTAVETK